MAKEGQTTLRLGSQSVFNNVREVWEESNCDLEKSADGLRRGQVAAGGRWLKDERQSRW